TLTGPSSGRLRGASSAVTVRGLAASVALASATTSSRSRRVAGLMANLRYRLTGQVLESAPAGLNRPRPVRPCRSRGGGGALREDPADHPLRKTEHAPLAAPDVPPDAGSRLHARHCRGRQGRADPRRG